MEDEDVDSVGNKFGESNNIDCQLSINSIGGSCENDSNCRSPNAEGIQTAEEEISSSVNKLKSALVNHDKVDIDRFKENEESGCTDLPCPSPKKVNGEIEKSASCASSEESCDDYDKNESVNISEDLKREFENEADASDSKDSNKRKRPSLDHSDASNDSENESDDESSSNSSPVEFRGFKRRKIFEMGAENLLNIHETNRKIEVVNNDTVVETEKPKSVELRRSARNASIAKRHNSEAVIGVETKEESGDQLTEYAQYLGLQPTVKFKCGRCGEKHFQSMASLNAHQMICCKTSSNVLTKQTKPQSDSNLSTNFRITRKVYLCSACGTYYENWKLFLHMRDMHKRHICLFCLGMFSVAERLAEHLLYQHNVHEKTCKSPEEFLNLFKGSCYLTCCSCEKMFTERDDFYDHQCKDTVISNPSNWNDSVSLTPKDIKELAQKCNLCGVKCGHFRTCPKVAHKFQQNSQSSSCTSSPSAPNSNSTNLSLEKYYVPVPANVQKNWTPNNLNQEILKQALSLSHLEKDYYDVGSAASFCHVDIANDSDNQCSSEKAVLGKLNIDHKKCPKFDNRKSPSRCQDVEDSVVNKDQSEQQGDCSKLLPNNTNPIVNSVSEESDDNTEDRVNSIVCKKQDEEEMKKDSDDEKSTKELNDVDDDDSDYKMSTEEDVNIQENLEKIDDNKVDENGIIVLPNESDKTPATEDEDKKDNDKSKKLENEILSSSLKIDTVTEDAVSRLAEKEQQQDGDEEKEEEMGNQEVEENEEEEDFEEEEEISQHDSVSNSSSVNSRSSSRNSTDNDHNSQDNIINNDTVDASIKTEDHKKENSTENVSIDEDHAENTLDESSSSNEEKLSRSSNEETNDVSVENNKEMVDKSDGNESDDSDKLSVVLCEDELAEKTNDDDSNSCKETPINVPVDNCDNLGENMETDVTSEQGGANGGDGNDSSTLQEGDTENDVAMEESQDTLPPKENYFLYDGMNIQLASEEVMAMALTLEDKMDSLSSQSVVKECVRTSCTTCSYCSHAVKIGVNGKQLAIHLLTEHRYMPVKNETVEDIIERLKTSLDELQDVWFNTDSYDSSDKSCFVPYDHTYECFQCNYSASTHKDLFSHKRKVHQKTILYCSMCKESFYSYSELLCHMCPGLYDAAKDIQFRCCLCPLDRIPSAFRLMVHLRKTHHTCDMCLEIVDDQQKLSAHMVKHKLHHLCYRCGIAYRNKPDITKHLFWKHGTESVLCKKCLQKKWPHVYHFCIPPSSFICEECNLSFSKAVYLKVHKRFHNNSLPYTCKSCEQKFVSKKLLNKHERTHEIVTAEDSVSDDKIRYKSLDSEKNIEQNDVISGEPPTSLPEESSSAVPPTETPEKSDESSIKPHKKKSKRDKEKKIKPVVDVYDLPPLNLSSESDDTEDEKETRPTKTSAIEDKDESSKPDEIRTSVFSNDEKKVESDQLGVESETKTTELNATESIAESEESAQPVTVIDGIWDNFHTYKAEQEKRENLDNANKQSILSQLDPSLPPVIPKDTVLGDHDYCLPNNAEEKSGEVDEADPAGKSKSNEHSSSIDHDYCTQKNNLDNSNISSSSNLLNATNQSENTETPPKRKQKSPKKKMMKQHNSSSSSDSSSESDSTSCSCGTNCSCTSSSSNSSSWSSSDSDSSSSDGRNNNSSMSTSKREKKKERLKSKRKEAVKIVEPQPPAEEPTATVLVEPEESPIKESDLETDETATDEEFYDRYPQMQANQILAEKRNQLMLLATVAPTVNNGSASPPVPNHSNSTNINLDPISSPKLEIVAPPVTPVVPPQTQSKKKVKTKKRRKSSSLGTANRNRSVNKQHNAAYDTPQPSTSFSSLIWQSSPHRKKVTNDISPMFMQSSIQPVATTPNTTNLKTPDHMLLPSPVTSHQQFHHSHEGSEVNSSKRSSKRRRVRNKFYGYSSDEEGDHQQTPPIKWKKFSSVDGNVKAVHSQQPQQLFSQPSQQVVPAARTEYNHSYQQQTSLIPTPPKVMQQAVRTTFEENQVNNTLVMKRTVPTPISSGSSSDSDGDSDSDTNRLEINQQMNVTSITATGLNTGTSEKDDKLYCYCQCPYDEVSEMIACDGLDCAIEWFHFECVGIMVPPKGKWYCPDCRKRRGLS